MVHLKRTIIAKLNLWYKIVLFWPFGLQLNIKWFKTRKSDPKTWQRIAENFEKDFVAKLAFFYFIGITKTASVLQIYFGELHQNAF